MAEIPSKNARSGYPLARWLTWLMRLGFHLLYNQLAWTYDLVARLVSRGHWQAWGQTALPHLQGPRVLDLGHGPGHLLGTLLGAGFKAAGLDRSLAMGRMARHRLVALGFSPSLVRGAAQELAFPAASFDSVVATFPSETIMEQAALSEVRRVLDPTGVLVIVPLAYLTGNKLIDQGLEWAYRLTGQRGDGVEQVKGWLAKAGFEAEVRWTDLADSRVMVVIGRPQAFRIDDLTR